MDVQGNEGQVDQGAAAPQTTDPQQGRQAQQSVDGQQGEQGTGNEDQGQQQEAGTQNAEGQQRDEKGRFKGNGVQDRIDELTRARREAEREAAYWRSMSQQGTQAQTPVEAPQKPTPDQFDDYGEYIEALTDWKTEQAVQKRLEQDSARKVQETKTMTFHERVQKFAQETPDFVEVVQGSQLPIATHVTETLQESEYGAQLLYHFAKNPDALDRLNRMDARTADREIGRIEASFVSPSNAVPAPTVKVTKAPAPANTTTGTQGRATTPALGEMSMEQYKAERAKQGARWSK